MLSHLLAKSTLHPFRGEARRATLQYPRAFPAIPLRLRLRHPAIHAHPTHPASAAHRPTLHHSGCLEVTLLLEIHPASFSRRGSQGNPAISTRIPCDTSPLKAAPPCNPRTAPPTAAPTLPIRDAWKLPPPQSSAHAPSFASSLRAQQPICGGYHSGCLEVTLPLSPTRKGARSEV